jgi:CHAT domain-containing protein
MKKSVYFFLLFFTNFIYSATAQVYNPFFETCERYYYEGDYKRALEECNHIIAKLKKQSKGFAVANGEIYQAKYLEATSDFVAFEEVLGDAIKNNKISGEKSNAYGVALLDAAYLYLSYSNTQKAEELFLQSCKVLDIQIGEDGKINKAPEDTYIRTQALYIQAKIYFNRGYIDKFDLLIPELLAYRQRRITDTDYYYDENNQKLSTKISVEAKKRRWEEYAEILTLRAEGQLVKGNYKKAQEYLHKADNWILSTINKRSIAYMYNQHIQNLLALVRGDELSKVKNAIKKNFESIDKAALAVNKVYIAIQALYIRYNTEQKNVLEGDFQRWDFRQNAAKYYGSLNFWKIRYDDNRSLPSAKAKMQDSKSYAQQKRLSVAMTELQVLYNNTMQVPTNHESRIHLLQQMYETSIAQDNYKLSLELGNELVKTVEKIQGKNSLNYYYAQLQLASYYTSYTSNFKKADSLLQDNFYKGVVKLIVPENKVYTEFLNQLATFYVLTDRYDSAKIQIDKAILITKTEYGESNVRYAAELNKLIKFEILQGNYNDAYKNIVQMLAIFDKNKDKTFETKYAEALETAANYYATLGLYSSAQEALAKAIRLRSRTNASIANSEAIDELAFLYIKMNKYDIAEAMLQEAVKLRLERYGEKSRFLINPYNQLSRLFLIEGEYTKAADFAEKALKLSNDLFGENSLQNVESVIILAEYNAAIGDFEKAKIDITQAIAKQESILGKEHVKLAASLTQYAMAKFLNKEPYNEIEKIFKDAQQLIAKNIGTDNPIYAESLKNLALVHTESQKYSEAMTELQDAQNIWQKTYKTPNSLQNAEIQTLIGDIQTRQNQFSKAAIQYNAALKIIASQFSKKHPTYTNILTRLARMYYIAGDLEKSEKYIEQALTQYKLYIKEFFTALSDREKSKYWGKIRNDFEFYNNLILKKARTKPMLLGKLYDNILLTKTLLVGASTKVRNTILASPDSALRNTYEKWEKRKADLTEALALSDEQQKDENKEPKKIEKEIEALEKTLLKNEIFRQQKEEVISWVDIKKTLQAKEVAVEMMRFRYFDRDFTDSVCYVALVLLPNSETPKVVTMQEGNLLETNYSKFYQNNIKFSLKDEKSYSRYWKPIDDLVGTDKTIYFSAEGSFTQINPENLLMPDGNYVIDKQEIVLLSTTKDLVSNTSNTKNNGRTMIIVNPAFYQDLSQGEMMKVTNRKIPQLPGAQTEGQEIFGIYKTANKEADIVLNFDATEKYMRENIKKPRILHIATHGFFAPNAVASSDNSLNNQRTVNTPLLNSGLLFYRAGELMASNNIYNYNKFDGVATAYEITSWDLEGTLLVIASACETGRGDIKVGEGVYGLQRALQVAGAKLLLMSLFKVSDEATRYLMVNFITNIEVKNMTIRAALIDAKKQLRATKFKDPIYWGSFLLIGKE